MKLSNSCLIFLFFFVWLESTTLAQQSDTLFLRNGQILIGKVKSISQGIVEFDDKDLSLQNIKYTKVRTINAYSRRFRIQTTDKKLYIGTIKPSDFNTVVIDDGYIEKTYRMNDIYLLVSLENRLIKKIRGTISFGYSFTKSSDIGRLNSDTNLKFTENNYSIYLAGTSSMTQNEGEFSVDNVNQTVYGLYDVTTLLNTGILLNYQRNIGLGLNWRIQQGAAIGYHLLMKDNLQGNFLSGAAISQESDLEQTKSGTLFEIPAIFNLQFFMYSQPNLQFSINQSVFFGISQEGRIRADGNYRVNWEIVSNFIVGLQFYFNSDNKELAGSEENNFDYSTVFNLGYKLK